MGDGSDRSGLSDRRPQCRNGLAHPRKCPLGGCHGSGGGVHYPRWSV